MDKLLEEIALALDAIGELVRTSGSDDRTLKALHGWNHPALTRLDLAEFSDLIASKIRRADIAELDEDTANSVKHAVTQLNQLKQETIPYLFNGNGSVAVPAYMATLVWLDSALEPALSWHAVNDVKLMPAKLASRVRSINARLEQVAPDLNDIENKIRAINGAAEAADSLPTDLEDLKKARQKIDEMSASVSSVGGKIEQRHVEVESMLEEMRRKAGEAQKLVEQCSEAYRITTTVGLAAAFEQRAKNLGFSMWIWVSFLLVSLIAGAKIGAERVSLLTAALANTSPNWGVIWIHVVLSVISVGAPLWFAWLATKQIGQRFRLAEDYGYKASVAKAYEGYRREAARLDEDFENRLFSSALSRLEEAPLRLVEGSTHGSPWHELVNSDSFKEALEKVPSLKFDLQKVSSRFSKPKKDDDQSSPQGGS